MKLGPNQTAWLELLESGELPQGTGGLENKVENCLNESSRYCCLGVGCILAEQAGAVTLVRYRAGQYEGLLAGGFLGHQPGVQGFLGLRHDNGAASPDQVLEIRAYVSKTCGVSACHLFELNDNGVTHPQIAEIILCFPDAYFKESK